MEFLQRDEMVYLVNIGFAACMKGRIALARSLFADLLELQPDLKGARTGLAFSYIVTDEFERGDEILQKLLDDDPNDLDIRAFLAFSKALQHKADEVQELTEGITQKDSTAYNLARQAQELAAR